MRQQCFAFSLLLTLPALFLPDQPVASAEEQHPPAEIKPEQARQYVGQSVRVLMTVKSSKFSMHKKCVFLDSEEDFRSERNLGVIIEESALAELTREGIEEPHDFFRKMDIRVTGPVEIREERPYLIVKKSAQIKVVRP